MSNEELIVFSTFVFEEMKQMKKLLILLVFILFSCKEEGKQMKYKGSNGKDSAILDLTIKEEEDRFYGTYEVFYGGNDKVKDSGKVSGEIIGDTLKGKFVYISYGGGESIKPFVLLKSEKNYSVGSGVTANLLGIPYFLPETISFKENFLLEPSKMK